MAFNYLQAQDNENNSKVGFSAEFSVGKTQSVSNNAMSIFPNGLLQSDNSADFDLFVGAYVADKGHLGIRYSDMTFHTTSPYNETLDISSFTLDAKRSKALPYNFEIFIDGCIGASLIRNFHTIDESEKNAMRIAFCCGFNVGIDYCFNKCFVGVKGGLFCAGFGKTKEEYLDVPTTSEDFLSVNTDIKICFGIRL